MLLLAAKIQKLKKSKQIKWQKLKKSKDIITSKMKKSKEFVPVLESRLQQIL